MQFFVQKKHGGGLAVYIPILLVGLVIGLFFGRMWGASASPASRASTTGTVEVLGIGQEPPSDIAQSIEFKRFWDVWRLLEEKYYRQPIDQQELFYGALQGLAGGLDDPYTSFFDPRDAENFQISLDGRFSGIGAEIGIKNERISVVAPLPDTPAERAGLKSGDLIISVNDQDTTGWTVEEAVTKIRGEKGTEVVLGIFRPDSEEPPFDVPIVRDEIKLVSVREIERDDNLMHIAINNFNGDTRANFDRLVDEAVRKNPDGIILDLRNNPGGFLEIALFIAGEWVGDEVIVKERRQGVIFAELRGTGRGRLRGVPTVVLVNEGSASASEIVAGALQDYSAATIVGAETFGKGSVQDYINLDDGSAVKITIAEWLTPNERVINEVGLTPDVVIEPTEEDYEQEKDVQLEEAVKILSGGEEE